jgi:putative redox protein
MAESTRMTVRHLGGSRYAAENAAGSRVSLDGDSGVSPMEALLAALGSCTAFGVVEILEKRRTPAESYRIELEGERAGEHPRRYTRILVRHVVRGTGISRKSLERTVALSHAYCPVAATLGCEIRSEAVLLE